MDFAEISTSFSSYGHLISRLRVQIKSIHVHIWNEIIYVASNWAASSLFFVTAWVIQSELSLMTCSLDVFIPVCSTFQLTKGKTGECVMWLTDWVSWALVQHMKNLSLLLQLLAWPSSSLCLMKRRWRMKSLCEENRKAAFFGSPSLWLNFVPGRHKRWRRGKRNLRVC